MTITEFIRARLDEEESAARGAYGNNWHDDVEDREKSWVCAEDMHLAEADHATAHHMALHDPARVLREIAAKRSVLDMALTEQEAGDRYGAGFNEASEGWHDVQEHVLKQLASAHADHTDYQQEWAL